MPVHETSKYDSFKHTPCTNFSHKYCTGDNLMNQPKFILNQISHKTYLSKHNTFTNMNLYITFLFQLFTATFTGLAIKWTNSIWFIKPGFFSNCSSHTSQDNNVLTKHNPSTPISFQNVNHILHKTTMYWPDTTLLNIINIKCFR